MKKILIIGSGGAGKSTMAQELGEILNIEVIHLDAVFWKPGWEPTKREEFVKKLKILMEKDQWIMDGNFGSTLDLRLKRADTVIFLDYSRFLCVYRILKRRWMYHRKTRPDMGEGCKEKLDWEFVKWVWDYPKKKRPDILNKLRQVEDVKQVIHLRSPNETAEFLRSLVHKGGK
ncbi:adenylate kinase family enzyme [Melghiribacillus thermohalophilus]|uniref:Adenylate kinase family enzyme n=1 Tax=Melghiribacillus thermohalophilus TaxID=1324956 RepID=A0A4R3MXN5_9BACI|nr:DNA topology modulation protein [Melghiribacillus thermohalophilus]TCT20336.1 adenylate kinase family enzyme [Melghiribacillus thermohalophilus]